METEWKMREILISLALMWSLSVPEILHGKGAAVDVRKLALWAAWHSGIRGLDLQAALGGAHKTRSEYILAALDRADQMMADSATLKRDMDAMVVRARMVRHAKP